MSTDQPRYGFSVAYGACPTCAEGALRYDPEAGESRCPVCDARLERD